MRHGDTARLRRMREVLMAAATADVAPSLTLQPVDDHGAVNMRIGYILASCVNAFCENSRGAGRILM